MGRSYVAKEPNPARAICFFDGQNLFHSAKSAFGYTFPNYDVVALAEHVCRVNAWQRTGVRFYTGVPDPADNAFWNHFWTAKCAQLGREGVVVYTRPLVYRNREVKLPDGSTHTFLAGDEKGIDVRLAIDVISCVLNNSCDVAVIFSRDQDLSELADEVRSISIAQKRWIKVASAYPYSPAVKSFRGINRTQWIPIDRATYDACVDKRDYRPKPAPKA
jgi:uncharacterized LabA/DUF88 family protein